MAPNFISIISTVLQSVDDIYSDSRPNAVPTELKHTQEGQDKLSTGYDWLRQDLEQFTPNFISIISTVLQNLSMTSTLMLG